MSERSKVKLDEEAVKNALGYAVTAAPPSADLWLRVELAMRRPREPQRRSRLVVVAAGATLFIVLAAVLTVLQWGNRGPSANATYVTRSIESLSNVKAVYVHQESRYSSVAGVTRLYGRGPDLSTWIVEFADRYELQGCRTEELIRKCAVVEKASGKVVGENEMVGGRRTTERYYLFPDRFFVRHTDELDTEIRSPESGNPIIPRVMVSETLYVDGRVYVRNDSTLGNAWRESPRVVVPPGITVFEPSPQRELWGLFQGGPQGAADILRGTFRDVKQLEQEVVGGVLTTHYRAVSRSRDRQSVFDIWIGVEDGLPRKAIYEWSGRTIGSADETAEGQETYVFGRFNEPLEIPPEPSPDEVMKAPTPRPPR